MNQTMIYIVGTDGTSQLVSAYPVARTLFAVHKPYGHDERWTLTHVPTQARICGSNSRAKLTKVAHSLAVLPIDWTQTDGESYQSFGATCYRVVREALS